MKSGPIVPMVWEGLNVVNLARTMLGDYNPFKAAPGTIRGDYAVQMDRNLCHGSDSVESAKKEIAFWFDGELTNWDPVIHSYVFKDLE